jgi:hypothetical protein
VRDEPRRVKITVVPRTWQNSESASSAGGSSSSLSLTGGTGIIEDAASLVADARLVPFQRGMLTAASAAAAAAAAAPEVTVLEPTHHHSHHHDHEHDCEREHDGEDASAASALYPPSAAGSAAAASQSSGGGGKLSLVSQHKGTQVKLEGVRLQNVATVRLSTPECLCVLMCLSLQT